jgi:hypothetical protein
LKREGIPKDTFFVAGREIVVLQLAQRWHTPIIDLAEVEAYNFD